MNECESLVSVYIPTKNRLELLLRAVESVVQQSYREIEIIIVDDGSDTPVCDSYELMNILSRSYLYEIIRFDSSVGAPIARNSAIINARGKYITGLDDDDCFDIERIETLLENYDSHYAFVCDNAYTVNDGEKIFENLQTGLFNLERILNANICNQVLTETYKVKGVGCFDEELLSNQDYDLWVRLIENYGDGLKISSYTYCYDIGHGKERISTSASAKLGAKAFFQKHSSKMTKKNLGNQYFRLIRYGASITFSSYLFALSYGPSFKVCKTLIRRFFKLL